MDDHFQSFLNRVYHVIFNISPNYVTAMSYNPMTKKWASGITSRIYFDCEVFIDNGVVVAERAKYEHTKEMRSVYWTDFISDRFYTHEQRYKQAIEVDSNE